MARFKQHDIERAVRAATKSGFVTKRIKFGPDGSFSLCFDGHSDGDVSDLDKELLAWKQKDASN